MIEGNVSSNNTITGEINSNSALSGNVSSNQVISGEISSANTLSGQVNSNVTLSGEVSANATVSGTVNSSQNINGKINNSVIEDYLRLLNKPQINGVELVGNKTLEELGIVLGGGGLKELELSLDFENPTYLPDLETGTYLIKNTGVTCTYEKGVLDNVISKNQLLTIVNLRDIFVIAGEEVSDEDNITWIYVKGLETGTYIKYGLEDWVFAYEVNSLNVNDYIDTSSFLSEKNISQGYGIKLENGILQPVIAVASDIDNQAMGRMISAGNVKYAVNKWEKGAPVLLWKNPNPNKVMEKTYITLTTINYDKYEVIYRDNITNNYYNSNVSFKFKGTILTNGNDTRVITGESSVNLTIENATNDNSNLVPVYILGYNYGLLS